MPKFDPKKFLSENVTGVSELPVPEGAETNADEIEELFNRAFLQVKGPNKFLDDVYAWWQDKGFLTERQYTAVKKFAGEEK